MTYYSYNGLHNDRERKCADTIGTLLVPRAVNFQCYTIIIFFKKYAETIDQTALGNCYGLKYPKC